MAGQLGFRGGILSALLLAMCVATRAATPAPTRAAPAAAAKATDDSPAWFSGPKFDFEVNPDSNASAVSFFQGQEVPTGNNQLSNTLTMDESGANVDAQNLQIKDITIMYGPDDGTHSPVQVGVSTGLTPTSVKYLNTPVLLGYLVDGMNIQLKARAGYHFVSISFGAAFSQTGNISNAFYVDGLGSSTVGSGGVDIASLVSYSEGKFVATDIYTPQITIVPNNNNVLATTFALDNVEYVLEQD